MYGGICEHAYMHEVHMHTCVGLAIETKSYHQVSSSINFHMAFVVMIYH